MFRDRSDLFPPDPNAPPPPPGRGVSVPRRMLEARAEADRNAGAFERELAQLRLIGPAAGAQLRRSVYGAGEHDNAPTGESALPGADA
jgi:hypothetical protein